jgi:hypothetical protein
VDENEGESDEKEREVENLSTRKFFSVKNLQ